MRPLAELFADVARLSVFRAGIDEPTTRPGNVIGQKDDHQLMDKAAEKERQEQVPDRDLMKPFHEQSLYISTLFERDGISDRIEASA